MQWYGLFRLTSYHTTFAVLEDKYDIVVICQRSITDILNCKS